MKRHLLRNTSPCLLAAGLFAASGLWAADVAFTGGAGGTGTDLSVAANWAGGVLPGADDTGVVDYGTYAGGGTLRVGGDLALAGLKIRGATGDVALNGPGTLSLGAVGLGVNTATKLTLNAPLAVTAASTWIFNRGAVDLNASISGTAALSFSEAGAVCVYAPIGYDGDLLVNSQGLRFYALGKMARTLKSTGGSDNPTLYVSPNAGGAARWSDIFTGGRFEYTAWRRLYLAVPSGATEAAHIVMDDPHDEFFQNGPYRSGIASGILEQRDGYLHANNYGISVGTSHVGTGAAVNGGRFPVEYRLAGGSNDVCYVFIGENAKYFTNNPVLKQSGGVSKVRKGVYVGAATDSSEIGFAEYLLSGGTLYARDGTVATDGGSDHQTRGIVLCHPFGGVGSCPGVFTQTGGTNATLAVRFGPDSSEWGGAPKAITAGFGLFDFRGGVLNFTSPTSPFQFGAGWNAGATGSTYRVNVSGGTINFRDGQRISAQIELPPSESGSAWNVPSGTVTVDAPLSGSGTLRKTGAGQIVFNDLNRFGGTLRVEEGVAKVLGVPEDDVSLDAATEDCWIWTADSLDATHTNGQDVAEWPDDRHGVTAVDWTQAGTQFYAEWLKSPTFTQNGQSGLVKGYPKHLPVLVKGGGFNGHSAVKFDRTLLQVPAAANPLAGATNLTIAAVYRMDVDGGNDCWYGAPILGGTEYYWGGMDTLVLTHNGAGRACINCVYQKNGTTRTIETAASRQGRNLKTQTCVAVLTLDGNDYSLNLNGFQTNAVLSSSIVRPMFRFNDIPLPLNFGGHFPDSANFASANSSFAEIRVYRNRSLTHPQQAALARQLMKTYVGTDAGEAEFAAELNTGATGAMSGEVAPEAPKATACEWTADSLDACEDGAEVTAWPSVDGTRQATTQTADSARGPTLVKGLYNGHGALRFSSADRTALGIAAADTEGKETDYALAVVFCTATDAPAANEARYGRSFGTGIATQDLSTGGPHFGLTWHHEGTLLAGYGSSWFVNRRPFRLDDGLPHVAVLSRDAAGNYVWMVDGRATTGSTADRQPNSSSAAMLLGRLAKGQETGYFDGDILAVRMYGTSLSVAEAKALSEHYAYTYGFRLQNHGATKEDVARNGFGRTTLDVAAGAQLVLPYSRTAPVTVTAANGRVLRGSGRVAGSVRFAAGGVLDTTAEMPDVEDLQLADGAVVKIGARPDLPADMGGVARIEGVVTIDATTLAQSGDGPTRTVALTGLGAGVVQPGASFAVRGLGAGARAELEDGTVTIVLRNSTVLIFR